jgi:periplasmic protein TonB
MKLFLALVASLLIHVFFIQWKTESDPEIKGSAGQAVLNIQQMRFITASAEPLIETNTDVLATQGDIEEAILEKNTERPVEKEQPIKPKEIIATLEKKKIPKPQEIEKKVAKPIEKPVKTLLDKKKKEHKPVEKQHVEMVIDNEKEHSDLVAEVESEIEIETEIEMTDLNNPTDTDTMIDKPETTAVEVVSTTETMAENTGFDQIPTMEEPRYRKAFPPKYPKLAKKRGQQGLVLLRAKVDKQGEVEMVEVIASSGVKSLDTRALETVEQWQFYPYTIADEATVAWVNIPVAFTLK